MPFLRFARDKRGYESTFVMHAGSRRGKSRPRILYWFRTPPHVRVGRTPLDADAVRLIEASHPDLAFDWHELRKAEPPPEPAPADPRARRRDRPERRGGADAPSAASRLTAEVERRGGARAIAVDAEAAPSVEVPDSPLHLPTRVSTAATEPDPEPAAPTPVAGPASETPAAVRHESGGTGDRPAAMPGPADLRARFAQVQARIAERGGDAERQAHLRAFAARLDPDTWTTPEQMAQGMSEFDATLATLEAALGKRRRRSRRGGARRAARRRSTTEGGGQTGSDPAGTGAAPGIHAGQDVDDDSAPGDDQADDVSEAEDPDSPGGHDN